MVRCDRICGGHGDTVKEVLGAKRCVGNNGGPDRPVQIARWPHCLAESSSLSLVRLEASNRLQCLALAPVSACWTVQERHDWDWGMQMCHFGSR